jgi:hypothetical protein
MKSDVAAQTARLTRRQRVKYAMLDKPGLGFCYFFVSYIVKGGFLDGLAGYRFNRLKWRYFDQIRSEIKKMERGST